MGFFNELLGKMKLMPEDDEFDDEFDHDIEQEEEDAVEEVKGKEEDTAAEKKSSAASYSTISPLSSHPSSLSDNDRKKTSKVVTMKSTISSAAPKQSTAKRTDLEQEVCMIMPKGYEDASEIADVLLRGKCVVLNLEGMNIEAAQRIIDFATGACYVMGGNLQKISKKIFIVTPSNVELTGDFTDLLGDTMNLSTLNLTM